MGLLQIKQQPLLLLYHSKNCSSSNTHSVPPLDEYASYMIL